MKYYIFEKPASWYFRIMAWIMYFCGKRRRPGWSPEARKFMEDVVKKGLAQVLQEQDEEEARKHLPPS